MRGQEIGKFKVGLKCSRDGYENAHSRETVDSEKLEECTEGMIFQCHSNLFIAQNCREDIVSSIDRRKKLGYSKIITRQHSSFPRDK